jgi:PAS domain S-box-containing protein
VSGRGQVAVVTPRPERRSSAGAWGPLLRAQADLHLCGSPLDGPVERADLVVLDEECPELDRWIADASAAGRSPGSIVVFSTSEQSARGAISWGDAGEDVLATISDLLDRKRLLDDSDSFLADLRASNDRLDRHRARFARMVLEQSDALRGANESLTLEVERLQRLQALARFFAAPGPDETFAERLAQVAARSLGAAGAAVFERAADGWELTGRWKISARNAHAVLPDDAAKAAMSRPTTRKDHEGAWIPQAGKDPRAGIVAIFREGKHPDLVYGPGLVEPLRDMLAEGWRTRTAFRAAASRGEASDRILETLRSGLLKMDLHGHVTVANPAMAEILRTRVTDLEGAPLERVFPDDPHLLALLRGVISTGTSVDDVETYATTTTGRHVTVSVRASLVGDPAAPEGVLVLVADLSRRKEVEAEVRRADRLVALGRLSAGVAHEIRNPLAGIRTTAEILRSRVEGSDDLERFVDVILEESSRLDRIVGAMLQFAKPPTPRRTELSLPELLDHAARLAAGPAADKGITLEIESSDALPKPPADRDQILQVVLNLILNGVEATPPGGRIVIGARQPGPEAVHLVVEDGGEGVDAAIRERVFDPFFSTKPGGTGLGLSISQNILRQHGGRLRIEEGAEGRNRFVAVLPLVPPPAGASMGGGTWRTS